VLQQKKLQVKSIVGVTVLTFHIHVGIYEQSFSPTEILMSFSNMPLSAYISVTRSL